MPHSNRDQASTECESVHLPHWTEKLVMTLLLIGVTG